MAADLGVRVFTVGFGAPEAVLGRSDSDAENRALDEASLKEIAAITHGQYFRATNAERLGETYETLSGRVAVENQHIEITALFTALAAVLMLASTGLSLSWRNRLA